MTERSRSEEIRPMLKLVPVTKDNGKECIGLSTSEEHAHFVAPNQDGDEAVCRARLDR